jgi:hypothetical protein
MRAVVVEVGTDGWTKIPGFIPGSTTIHLHRVHALKGSENVSLCLVASVKGPSGPPKQMCVARLTTNSVPIDLRFGLEDASFRVVELAGAKVQGSSSGRVTLNGMLSRLSDAVDDVATDSDQD